MIQEGKAASSCFVSAAIPAKKQIIQASRTIIVTNMIGMGFCTGLFFSSGIDTEILPTSVAEFKGVLVQDRTADLTVWVSILSQRVGAKVRVQFHTRAISWHSSLALTFRRYTKFFGLLYTLPPYDHFNFSLTVQTS